uniref:Uncharacterized protein n=1 Tax=viral metagenome TaxID=1070528 RepID=A0A6C0KT00_9ZZZZ
MSPGPSNRENQGQTFLATLQNILAVLEDEVSPAIQYNTYIRLVNDLQILYNIHNGTSSLNRAYENNNYANLMNTARSFRNAMSLDEQRD